MHPKNIKEISINKENPYPKEFHKKLGQSHVQQLSDEFGLTHFGVNLETLQPGAHSSLKHYHTFSDEFILVISGTFTLHHGHQKYIMKKGDCMGFSYTDEIGHYLENHTNEIAQFIVMGSRFSNDVVEYTEDDLTWKEDDAGNYFPAHKNGKPY